ncbi:MAG TPA: protein kinase [Vicinamibacteria bacterium]|nr:protein kinase [Vicinamibacteria bacterium]
MTLTPGEKLGKFEILAAIGAGGMGEVYKARDLTLERNVALKLLPQHLTSDKERLARLEREARALASIEHPNIASLYSLEVQDGTSFLVMELASGETLSKRLARGPIPYEEALPLFVQICDALEAAHGRGILHRDLKPGNVQIDEEGRVKVLDFGLAKSLDEPVETPELTESPTRTKATEAGMILGTASYMSPEQARGKALDRRSDVWSFGCVAYEMLTGRRAFDGDTVTDILAAIVKSDPDWGALPDGVPWHVRRLLKRSLAKKREERLRDIGDALLELTDPPNVAEVSESRRPRARVGQLLAAAALGALIASGLWSARGGDVRTARPTVRLSMTFPSDSPSTTFGLFDVSPDGRTLIYTSSGRVYLRRFDEVEGRPLEGATSAERAFFSPDGRWVGYSASGHLYKVPVDGGGSTQLADRAFATAIHWANDGFVYFAETYSSPIVRVPENGGDPEPVTRLEEGDLGHWSPWLLPSGEALLYTVYAQGSLDTWEVRLQDLRSGATRQLLQGGYTARFIPDGYLLFGRSGDLLAVRFDPSKLELQGEPFLVQSDVLTSPVNGSILMAVTNDGTFLYGEQSTDNRVVWVAGTGEERPASTERRNFELPRSSPDGKTLAVVVREGIDRSIWLLDLVRGSLSRLTFGYDDIDPVWSPDGEWVYFTSAANGPYELFRVRSDGSGEPELILGGPVDKHATSISPDGRELAYTEQGPGDSIHILSLETRESRRLGSGMFRELSPSYSPDGAWIAYQSLESGRWEIYARRSDGSGARISVSVNGGSHPVWSRNGGEIFFINDNRMFAVEVPEGPSSGLGQPRALFSVDAYVGGYQVPGYDAGPNGELALVWTRGGSRLTELKIVLNWTDEVRRLDPAN